MQEVAVKNLLRPHQVRECREELSRLDGMLNAPPHVRSRVDVQEAARRRARLRRELEDQTPQPYSAQEKDAALKRFHQLGEEIKIGMPSDEVMRRNPPGAVQQHIAWDRRNKKKVLERKHIGLRLHASGDLNDTLGDAAINVELLRNRATGFDLPLDGAQIPRTTDYHMPARPDSVVLSEEQIDVLKQVDPELAGQLALLKPEHRSAIKQLLQKFMADAGGSEPSPPAPAIAPEGPKVRRISPAVLRMANLRKTCKANGINSFGLTIDRMIEELKAKGVAVEE